MRALTHEEIDAALERLTIDLDRYLWLQRHVGLRDVSTDAQFQTRFDAFYRVRRGSSWRAEYFALMESAKKTGVDFPQALSEINRRTGRLEASFASKLVATLNPATPVIDKFVLENFGLRLPNWDTLDRESRIVDIYRELCSEYEGLLKSPTGATIKDLFDRRFSALEITELKKVDLVLWRLSINRPL